MNGTPKSHKSRVVVFPRFLADRLAEHCAGLGPDDLVFTSPRGGHLRSANFRQDCLDTYMEMSGVYGKTAEELAEADHFSSWVFLGNEWRVEVVNEIETIRVLGPLQTAD